MVHETIVDVRVKHKLLPVKLFPILQKQHPKHVIVKNKTKNK